MQNKVNISFSETKISFHNQSVAENINIHYADIIFKVKYETQTGQEIRVLGGIEELGNWEPEKGLRMTTTKETYPIWSTIKEITCPVDTEINYKYIAFNINTKEFIWESNMSNRFLKVDTWGKIEIMEEKGNIQRKMQIKEIKNENEYENYNPKIDFSPIQTVKNYDNDVGGSELMDSMFSLFTDNKIMMIEKLNYDQVKIDDMQNNPLTIGLKQKIELTQDEDKFVILTALLPFNIIKNSNNNIINNCNYNNIINSGKYRIIPKYEDELYESLFRIREKKYDIYWVGMLDNYEQFYNENEIGYIDKELIQILNNEKIYVITPQIKDYINYWIYINHIIGKIFYENKIPVNDDYFINYDKYWESYKLINELFANKIFNESKSTDLIMIHDINLSLVSHFISQKNNYAKMGFYFHSFFPSLEVLNSLSFHQELLQSIMLCNLICFHHIDIAMKFLGAVQRTLDLYNEVKSGGNIIINYMGRIIHIHIMQIGIDLENAKFILEKKKFLEKKKEYIKKHKLISDKNKKSENINNINNENKILDKKEKLEKEKYIFFSYDGLLDKNNILIKFQAFDFFYKSYLTKLNNIKNQTNMDKIIEENEEYINSCKSIVEVKPILLDNSNFHKNLINNNSTINNLDKIKENKIDRNIKNENSNIEIKKEENNIKLKDNSGVNKNLKENSEINKIEKSKFIKNVTINLDNTSEINKKKIKKKKGKKVKGKKNKSKSGINLSQINKDIQIDLKSNKELNEIYLNKEPLFVQILKESENKIMNLYNYSEQNQENEIENNYNDIINLAKEINKKYNKEIIIVKRNPNFSIEDLYSLYSIGDCYYTLRKDYNSSIQIQLFIYICDYFNKTYDIILNENSSLSPGIKGVKKINEIDIFQNISALEKVFSSNYMNKYIKENNINFINNNQILNWAKIFFSKLKKISFNESNCQKIVIGLGLGFSLMNLRRDFIHLNKKEFTKDYHESNKALVFLDYEDIIQTFNKGNKEQKENVLSQLKAFSSQEKNKLYITSGCKKGNLDEIFGGIASIGLACEYGSFYKKPGENILQKNYNQLFKMNDWSWKKGILPILKAFAERTEGSYIIEKESMISWVYKNCDPDFGLIQANEMISHIKGLLFQNDFITVTDENDSVNIRPKNINKGFFISEILKQEYKNDEFPEFILAIGDQDGDEEMFNYLNYLKNNFEIKSKNLSIYSVTIGKRISNANYFLNECNEILEYIENLNKDYKSEGNSSSKFSQDIYNLVEQSDEYDLYSKKESYYDY